MKKLTSVQDELLYLCKKNKGVLNPHDIVEYAENPDTYLHSKFEWDDDKAAGEYRLEQARRIIRLEFEIIQNTDVAVGPVRLFVSLRDDRNKEGGYRLIENVVKDNDLRQAMIKEALMEFVRIRNKYSTLVELADIFTAIEKKEVLIFEKTEA